MPNTLKHKSKSTDGRQPRDLRLREKHFPGAESRVLDTAKGGYVPQPIIFRKLMRFLSPPELRVLVYLQTRCSKYFICFPTLEEIAHDLNLAGRRNLTPHLKQLERKKFIETRTAAGKKYFLVHNPRVAIQHLVDTGEIDEEQLFEINEVLQDLRQQPIQRIARQVASKLGIPRKPTR